MSYPSEGVGLTIDVSKAHKRLRIREDEWGLLLFQHRGKLYHFSVCHFGARFSAGWWSRMGTVLIRICHQFLFIQHGGWLHVDDFLFLLEATTAPLKATCLCCFLHLLRCPVSWHKIALGRQVRWTGLGIHFFSCFWQIPKEKRDEALQILRKVSRQGNRNERADLEPFVGRLMLLADSMPALRPWLPDFYLALAKPAATLLPLSRIQFEEAISRVFDTFVVTSHAELSGLRQGWRIITVARKDVESPQEAVEICPNVRGRIWGRALTPRSKYVKAPDNFRGTLEASDLTNRRALLQSLHARHATTKGTRSGRRLRPRYILVHREWCPPEAQSVTPGPCWWFQLQGSMADLPQSWRARTEALPLISCFELLAHLALLVCRVRSPLPTSGRITLRQRSDNVTASFWSSCDGPQFPVSSWRSTTSRNRQRAGRRAQSQQGIHQGFLPVGTAR